jgi:hypothetical protein
MANYETDILVVGASSGGCAAALSAAALGYHVVLTEETDWIGGQLTAQAVPPDEHRWIEQFGCTRRYRRLRDGIRAFYRRHYPLTPEARADPHLNPGGGWVSALCHEPRVALAVLRGMMAYPRSRRRLRVLLRRRPVAVDVEGDRVRAVTLRHTETGDEATVHARYILDATELGDLLPLAKVEYVTGAESRDQTGEPHAVDGPPQPDNVQAISWCFPMAYDPGGQHVIDEPDQYNYWRSYEPPLKPPWPGRLLSWTHSNPVTLEPHARVLFPSETEDRYDSLWAFRQIVTKEHYAPGSIDHDITLVNWPQIDYVGGSIIDRPEDEVREHKEAARQLSLSLLYWLQTEAPRPDGGRGYPGLYRRPDMVGTEDGLAKYPYVRESRRIQALFTVTERHVSPEVRGDQSVATFEDSVGIGSYRIDLHPSTGGDNYLDIPSLPFEIPLGALVPTRVENLLPACKNIGTTHITNGCYRLHPVEWNIGEAAGLLAAFCLQRGVRPRAVREKEALLHDFQRLLSEQGIELHWPNVGSY